MRLLRYVCYAQQRERTQSESVEVRQHGTQHNIGDRFLNKKCADIPGELANYSITETIIVQVENKLDSLGKQGTLEQSIPNELIAAYVVAVLILNKGKHIISDLVDKLDALMI
jgi:hypothetical protein